MIVPKTCSIIVALGEAAPVECGKDPYWWVTTVSSNRIVCLCEYHKYFHRTTGVSYEDALAYAAMHCL